MDTEGRINNECFNSTNIYKYDGLGYFTFMLSGAIAGIAEHCFMYPLDTIRTRAQALSHPGQQLHKAAIYQSVKTIIKREGLKGLYRGFGAMIAGAGPSHACHFMAYESAKNILGANQPGHNFLATACSGAFAAIIHDGLMTPADVVKQRLQIVNSPYSGIKECFLRIIKDEGILAFYRSYKTTLVMNIPFMSIQVTVYESCKKIMGSETDDSLLIQLIAGGLAGAIASGASTPLDVVKTRLQTEGVTSLTKYPKTAVLMTLNKIISEEGHKALWRGLKPRIMFHIPSAAICWSTYETMKFLLTQYCQH